MIDTPEMSSILRSSRSRLSAEAERLLNGSSLHGRLLSEFGSAPLTRREAWAIGIVDELIALLKNRRHDDDEWTESGDKDVAHSTFTYGSLVINCERREVTIDGRVIELAPKEYQLLVTLAERNGAAVSLDAISRRLWNKRFDKESRALYQLVGDLRRKIEPDARNPRYVRIVRKYGYRLAAPSSS